MGFRKCEQDHEIKFNGEMCMSEGEAEESQKLNIKEILHTSGKIRIAITDYCELHTIDSQFDICWDSGFWAMWKNDNRRILIVKLYIFNVSEGRKEIITLAPDWKKKVVTAHFAALHEFCELNGVRIEYQNSQVQEELKKLIE
jgi:hypothetical protein